MYCRLLLEKLEGIDSDAKFFLLKLLQNYWEEQEVSISNKELLKSFGVYDKSVKSVLKVLLEKRYLALNKRLTGAKGRPKQTLCKGEVLQELVRKWATESTVINHESPIEKLLEVTAEREQIVSQHSIIKPPASRVLTNTRKLLLCVLLAKADQFGVVRNLGMTELAALVGLSKVQLRWHLKILKGSQFLLGYISGKSIKGIKGKLKSSFVLRLGNFIEGDQSASKGQLISSGALKKFERAVHLAKALETVNGNLGGDEFIRECLVRSDLWLTIYGVSNEELKDLLSSRDFFLSIIDMDGSNYRRICELVCELTTTLFTATEEGSLEGVLSNEDVAKKVAQEIKKRKLSVAGERSGRFRGLAFLSRVVWMFYKEVLGLVRNPVEDGKLYRVDSCLIEPLMDDNCEVIVHLSMHVSHKKVELSPT